MKYAHFIYIYYQITFKIISRLVQFRYKLRLWKLFSLEHNYYFLNFNSRCGGV